MTWASILQVISTGRWRTLFIISYVSHSLEQNNDSSFLKHPRDCMHHIFLAIFTEFD